MITPTAGQRWQTRDGALGLAPVRFVTVIDVVKGKHNIDRGPTATPADDEVQFSFADGTKSRCGITAFRRTYVLA